jgi:hypothetical protein
MENKITVKRSQLDQHMFLLNMMHNDLNSDKRNLKLMDKMILELNRLKDTIDLEKEKIKLGK